MACIPPGSSVRVIFPSKITGMGCHFLLQGFFPTWESLPDPGIFPTQGSNSLSFASPALAGGFFFFTTVPFYDIL